MNFRTRIKDKKHLILFLKEKEKKKRLKNCCLFFCLCTLSLKSHFTHSIKGSVFLKNNNNKKLCQLSAIDHRDVLLFKPFVVVDKGLCMVLL